MSAPSNAVPYQDLSPEEIIAAVESTGRRCDGRLLALNSYENRVYQVGVEDATPLVAKFYRPGRWTDAAIQEEHGFTLELEEAELLVLPPLVGEDGATLHHHGQFRFALYRRQGGRAPELDSSEHLQQAGRLMARIHNVGATGRFTARPRYSVARFGDEPSGFLMAHGVVPESLFPAYSSVVADALDAARSAFEIAGDVVMLRIHGDAHPGNLMHAPQGLHIVDFDDTLTGPAIQDLWMFLSGDRDYMSARLADLLRGYTEFRDFDARELHLIEALRTLRLIHHSAWLANRWTDPAFPLAFPWFDSPRYWSDQILTLREQCALMQEPPLPYPML